MATRALGPFEGQADIGSPQHSGTCQYDAEKQVYTIAGAGAISGEKATSFTLSGSAWRGILSRRCEPDLSERVPIRSANWAGWRARASLLIRRITPTGPSYLHGWSPDGQFLVYTGQRHGQFDIYRIAAGGGEEVQLTNSVGLDDGPEYAPDGEYIYFNSVRSGRMQIWRMQADGSGEEQLTDDEYNNWFPHISPDGQWVAFITYLVGEAEPSDHPAAKRIYLRLMPRAGGEPRVLAYLYGGQGTMNVPSWSPDSKRLAFVSNTVPRA